MATDCYFLLGVPRDANQSQIKRAYRVLSHRYHPDHVGPAGEERFLRIKDAYDVLRDPLRRADHNRQLEVIEGASRRSAPTADVMEPIDLFQSFQTHRPSFEALHDLLLRNFTGHGIPKSRPVQQVTVELVLSPAQAEAGGDVPIDIPLARICPTCQGTGQTGFFECDACGGHGMHWEVERIDVLLPRAVADGTVIPLSLRHLGVNNLYLNLRVCVIGGRVRVA